MKHGTKRRTWRRRLLWGGGIAGAVLLCFLVVVIGFRKPWIEPLPGVRTEMTRPFVRESDLGPDSAYFLMLAAIRIPVEAQAKETAPTLVWSQDWSDALTKFKHHPWPAEPPPAEPAEPAEEWGDGEMLRCRRFPPPEAPWTREQYEDILRLNRIFEPQVALLDQALAAPDPQMPTVDSLDFAPVYLQDVRAMARWLAVSGHHRAGTGDFAGAFQDFERILGLGNLVCRGGATINYLVGMACDAIAADAAWVVASRERVPATILKDAARTFLFAADESEPLVEAIRSEYLYAHSAYSVKAKSPSAIRNMEAFFQHMVVFFGKPYRSVTVAEYRQLRDRLRPREAADLFVSMIWTSDNVGRILAAMLLPSMEGAHRKSTHRETMLRGMALFLAVRAYETEHGEPPDTLDPLVPDYLPRVPEDPFDGKPFRYLRRNVPGLPPEAWAVYSVGENFTDDGGTACGLVSLTPASRPNPDLVWPSMPYPAEKRPIRQPPEGIGCF